MGKNNFFSQRIILSPPLSSPFKPYYISTLSERKKEGKEKTLLYPVKVRTTKPPTNTSESVAK
jgi:hypothetical protein